MQTCKRAEAQHSCQAVRQPRCYAPGASLRLMIPAAMLHGTMHDSGLNETPERRIRSYQVGQGWIP